MDPVVSRLNMLANLAERLVNEYNNKKLMTDTDLRYAMLNREQTTKRIAVQDNSVGEILNSEWFTYAMWWVNTATFLIEELKGIDPPEDYNVNGMLLWRRYYTALDEKCKKLETTLVKIL